MTHEPSPTHDTDEIGDLDLPAVLLAPNLVRGESAAEYNEVLLQAIEHFRPRTLIQRFAVKRLADLFWDIGRYGRLKPHITEVAREQAVRDFLLRVLPRDTYLDHDKPDDARREDARKLASAYMGRAGKREYEVAKEILESHLFTPGWEEGQTLVLALSDLDRIESLISRKDAQWLTICRELEAMRDLPSEPPLALPVKKGRSS